MYSYWGIPGIQYTMHGILLGGTGHRIAYLEVPVYSKALRYGYWRLARYTGYTGSSVSTLGPAQHNILELWMPKSIPYLVV